MTLDEAEKQAHEMLDALRREYELRAAPYIKILSQIHALRPRVFYIPVENGKPLEMIPLQLPTTPQNRVANLNKPTEHHSGCAVYDITRPELGECSCGFDPP